MTSTARSDMRLGELLDRDRLGQHDLARDLLLVLLRAVTLQPLGAAAERGDRARALLLARGGAGDGQAAAVALLAAARRARRRHDDLLSRQDQRSGAGSTRLASSSSAGRARGALPGRAAPRCGRSLARHRTAARRRFAAGEAPARLVLRLTLEFGFLLRGAAPPRACALRRPRARRVRAPRARAERRRPPPGGGGPPPRARARRSAPGRAPRAAPRSEWAARRRSWAGGRRGGVFARRDGRPTARRRRGRGRGRRRPAALGRRGSAARRLAGVQTRRFTFSTTTALLRPCEKLCRTVPCSTGRFRCSVAFGGGAPRTSRRYCSFHSCVFPTARLLSQFCRPVKRSGLIGRRAAAIGRDRRVRFAYAIAAQTIRPCEEGRTRRAPLERSMYHICPAQCQIQLARREQIYRARPLLPPGRVGGQDSGSLGRSVRRAVARLNQRRRRRPTRSPHRLWTRRRRRGRLC